MLADDFERETDYSDVSVEIRRLHSKLRAGQEDDRIHIAHPSAKM
jgi:hypothetical protein